MRIGFKSSQGRNKTSIGDFAKAGVRVIDPFIG